MFGQKRVRGRILAARDDHTGLREGRDAGLGPEPAHGAAARRVGDLPPEETQATPARWRALRCNRHSTFSIGSPARRQATKPPATSAAPLRSVAFDLTAC